MHPGRPHVAGVGGGELRLERLRRGRELLPVLVEDGRELVLELGGHGRVARLLGRHRGRQVEARRGPGGFAGHVGADGRGGGGVGLIGGRGRRRGGRKHEDGRISQVHSAGGRRRVGGYLQCFSVATAIKLTIIVIIIIAIIINIIITILLL